MEVLLKERHERGQEGVGAWLAVHTIDDLGSRQAIFGMEPLNDGLRPLALQEVAQQVLAHRRATSLIAKDKSQGRNVLHNALAIVGTRVASRAEDTSDAGLMATYRNGCAQHIGRHRAVVTNGERIAQRLFHDGLLLGCATSTIEINRVDLGGRQVGQQGRAYFRRNLFAAHLKRVESLSLYFFHGLVVIHQSPVGLGRTAVSYQYHDMMIY